MNLDLGKTAITDKVRVSSAAIFYENNFFRNYYQLETFIFSDDERQKTRMIIHYTCSEVTEQDRIFVAKVHNYVSRNMISKFF